MIVEANAPQSQPEAADMSEFYDPFLSKALKGRFLIAQNDTGVKVP
jgi:hypothetical protein